MSTNSIIAQVAAKMGYTTAFTDLIPGEFLKPTQIGIARCQSAGFAASLRKISKDMEAHKRVRNKADEAFNQMSILTAMTLCADENGKATMTDEDIVKFLSTNQQSIARIIHAAFMSNFPCLLQDLGVSTSGEIREA